MHGWRNPRNARLARRALAAGLCLWLGGALCLLTCELMPAEMAAMAMGLASLAGASHPAAPPHHDDACAPSGHDCCHPPQGPGKSGGSHAVSCCALLAQPLETVKKFSPKPQVAAVALESPRAPHAASALLVKDSPSGWPPDTVPLFLRNRVLLI